MVEHIVHYEILLPDAREPQHWMHCVIRDTEFMLHVVKLPGVEEWVVETFSSDTLKIDFKLEELEKQKPKITEHAQLPILIGVKSFELERRHYCRRIMPMEGDVCLIVTQNLSIYVSRIGKEAYYRKKNQREKDVFLGFEVFALAFMARGKARNEINEDRMAHVKPVQSATFADHPGFAKLKGLSF